MSPQMIAWLLLAGLGSVLLGAAVRHWIGRPWLNARRRTAAELAMRQFPLQREQLEAKFFDLARSSGKPRGLKWLDCDWQSEVTFARACDTGLLTAFVAVNLRFEAIAGGDMEGITHVDTLREAAAVFHFEKGRWKTVGRALFNMNPSEAMVRLVGQFEPVA